MLRWWRSWLKLASRKTALSANWLERYGAERIEITGSVTYRDVFGHLYETEFGFYSTLKDTGKFESMYRVKRGKAMFRKFREASEDQN